MSLCPGSAYCASEARKNWQPIGRLHPDCSRNTGISDKSEEFEQFQVVVEFVRHVHLSYMNFTLADNDGSITSKSLNTCHGKLAN